MKYIRLLPLFLIGMFLTACDHKPPVKQDVFPWQIKLLQNGGSQVFGMTLAETRLFEAEQKLGRQAEVALFEDARGLSLEAYFDSLLLGGLKCRMILTLRTTTELVSQLRDESVQHEPTSTGAYKYRLAGQARQDIRKLKIDAITYIPSVNLDEELVRLRFGEPDNILRLNETETRFIYQTKGLLLILNARGKDVLQYVHPQDFERLRLNAQ